MASMHRFFRRSAALTGTAVLLLATACVAAPAAPEQSTKFDDYRWSQVSDSAPWGRRAGVETVRLGSSVFLVGGRTPKAPVPFPDGPVPGNSTIWGDVWRSDDDGRTWTQTLTTDDAAHWKARAYHEVVVHKGRMVLLGGQNFPLETNPACNESVFCSPRLVARSEFFNDVWASTDGSSWEQLTAAAPWSGRAGLSAAVLDDVIYVMGGSVNDDVSIVGGPPSRKIFRDVWKSSDGVNWTLATASAPWQARAGGATAVKDGYLYLLGGEYGFTGFPPPYFNDVWRTRNGTDWELVTPAAGWSPRPGHTCDLLEDTFVCFGGYGQSPNPLDLFGRMSPTDIWISDDAATWTRAQGSPWNATSSDDVRYDYDTVVVPAGPDGAGDQLLTFGGDRETFNFFDPTQYLNVDDDVWRFGLPTGS